MMDPWVWSIVYNWLGGVWGGILLQMMFNEEIGKRLFPPSQHHDTPPL